MSRQDNSWRALLSGPNLVRSIALASGVGLHAISVFITASMLPSVVRDIGGLDYYAWNTSIFAVSSILGSVLSPKLVIRLAPRGAYAMSALLFAAGALICALSPAMGVMLIGRFIQGLGGGLLVSLPYAMMYRLFDKILWPKILALISSMWGVATLLGPAVGGVFAEWGLWRWGFGLLVAIALAAVGMALVSLPSHNDDAPTATPPLPILQILLLTGAVLAVSWSGVSTDSVRILGVLLLGLLLSGVLVTLERQRENRLFPSQTFMRGSRLGLLYAGFGLLAIAVSSPQIFAPFFLQEIHQRNPLEAGYIASLVSIGWSVSGVCSASWQGAARRRAFLGGSILSCLSLTGLALTMPQADGGLGMLVLIGLLLIGQGAGIGVSLPHITAAILSRGEQGNESGIGATIMTVELIGTGFGAAFAGLIVNLAGTTGGGDAFDVPRAAFWLLSFCAIVPVGSFFALRAGYPSATAAEARA